MLIRPKVVTFGASENFKIFPKMKVWWGGGGCQKILNTTPFKWYLIFKDLIKD